MATLAVGTSKIGGGRPTYLPRFSLHKIRPLRLDLFGSHWIHHRISYSPSQLLGNIVTMAATMRAESTLPQAQHNVIRLTTADPATGIIATIKHNNQKVPLSDTGLATDADPAVHERLSLQKRSRNHTSIGGKSRGSRATQSQPRRPPQRSRRQQH